MLTDEMVNREFSRVFKGYDVDEVEDYIEALVELYNQVANENRELALRCDALNTALTENKEKFAEAEDVLSRRDEILNQAEQQAHDVVVESREKAQSTIETAEATARELLLEIKEKSDRVDGEISEKKAQTDAECRAALDGAMEEAKKLIKATKLNCQKRQTESEEKIAAKEAEFEEKLNAAREEYKSLCDKARDFRCKLFDMYSEQITLIESLEIDTDTDVPQPSDAECPEVNDSAETVAMDGDQSLADADEIDEVDEVDEIDVVDEVDEIDEIDEVDALEPEVADATEADVAPSDADVADISVPRFADDESDPEDAADEDEVVDSETDTESEHEPEACESEQAVLPEPEEAERTVVFNVPHTGTSEKKYAAFEVHKERSGVVEYDSSELSSVRNKLEDITQKKGESSRIAQKNVSKKLGFLK